MKSNSTQMLQMQHIVLAVMIVASVANLALTLTTKADCQELWKIFGGHGNIHDSLRKVTNNAGMQVNANSIVSLYQDCLRAEEGIRYRRSGNNNNNNNAVSIDRNQAKLTPTNEGTGTGFESESLNGRHFLQGRFRFPLLASFLNKKEPSSLYEIMMPSTASSIEQLIPEMEK